MSGIATVNDACSGHGGFPPRLPVSGSFDVLVNGVGVLRVGDLYLPHSDGHTTHNAVIVSGSQTVFVNGVSLAITGSLLSCGSTIASGSQNSFAG
jgi:uncharacterized Zn-binding protein involved in type VI secretion